VAAGGALTGVVQGFAEQDHTHSVSATGTVAAATTSTDGAHTHNWGGWWSNDDSRDYASGAGNGDGNGNTISDGAFWWGGNPGTTGNPNSQYFVGTSSTNGNHSHGGNTGNVNATSMWIPYDDNTGSDASPSGFGNSNATLCGSGWNGVYTAGNFLGRLSDGCLQHTHTIAADGDHAHNFYLWAHRHWLKQRATTSAGAHSHTIPSQSISVSGATGAVSGANVAAETRPTNVAVVFWRRTN
jgi:hypothetical protein